MLDWKEVVFFLYFYVATLPAELLCSERLFLPEECKHNLETSYKQFSSRCYRDGNGACKTQWHTSNENLNKSVGTNTIGNWKWFVQCFGLFVMSFTNIDWLFQRSMRSQEEAQHHSHAPRLQDGCSSEPTWLSFSGQWLFWSFRWAHRYTYTTRFCKVSLTWLK